MKSLYINNLDNKLSSYSYILPKSFIAQNPAIPAHDAKLLVCKNIDGNYKYSNKKYIDLPEILDKNTVLFLNSTKVFKARIVFLNKLIYKVSTNPPSETKLDWEIFIYKIINSQDFECLVSDDKNFKPGNKIFWNSKIILNIKKIVKNGVLLSIDGIDIYRFMEEYGEMPLPPYISYEKRKEKYYQTNFARELWSSAAPTASLHFTEALLTKIKTAWLNINYEVLHVWLWTFKPVFSKNIIEYKIHEENMLVTLDIFEKITEYSTKWKKILAVWTTMTRYLESLPYIRKKIHIDIEDKTKYNFTKSCQKFRNSKTQNISLSETKKIISNLVLEQNDKLIVSTKLFIYPTFQRCIVDQIITNFHLPKSSLVMLVAWFMWRKNTLKTYEYAKNNNYKFYSFGDGMFINKKLLK